MPGLPLFLLTAREGRPSTESIVRPIRTGPVSPRACVYGVVAVVCVKGENAPSPPPLPPSKPALLRLSLIGANTGSLYSALLLGKPSLATALVVCLHSAFVSATRLLRTSRQRYTRPRAKVNAARLILLLISLIITPPEARSSCFKVGVISRLPPKGRFNTSKMKLRSWANQPWIPSCVCIWYLA